MRSLIFRTIAPFLTALMMIFSIFVLLRGHNEPGGGFIAGLIDKVTKCQRSTQKGVKPAQVSKTKRS